MKPTRSAVIRPWAASRQPNATDPEVYRAVPTRAERTRRRRSGGGLQQGGDERPRQQDRYNRIATTGQLRQYIQFGHVACDDSRPLSCSPNPIARRGAIRQETWSALRGQSAATPDEFAFARWAVPFKEEMMPD